MTCWKIRRQLPGYLDGALPGTHHALVREHVEFCSDCRDELERYRKLSALMSRAERVAPPADLAVGIRVAVAKERTSLGWAARANMWTSRAHLILRNILQPLALPATGGGVAGVLAFAVMYPIIARGVPLGAVPHDLPTNLLQPARLENPAPFPLSGPLGADEGGPTGANA